MLKSGLRIFIQAPEVPFLVPPKWLKHPVWGNQKWHFGCLNQYNNFENCQKYPICQNCQNNFENCQNNFKNCQNNFKNCENCQKLSNLPKKYIVCQKLSNFSKIVKFGKSCQIFQKLSNVSKIVKMLFRSCYLITLIKCLRGHNSSL